MDRVYRCVMVGHTLIVPAPEPDTEPRKVLNKVVIHHSMGDKQPKLGDSGCLMWQNAINWCVAKSGREVYVASHFDTWQYECEYNLNIQQLQQWHEYLNNPKSIVRGILIQKFNQQWQQYMKVCNII